MKANFAYSNGQPKFVVDGIPYDPVAYMSYAPDAEREREFRDNGMQFFSFTVMTGDLGINEYTNLGPFSKGFWTGYRQYDFTDVDRYLQMAAPEGSGAYIFPRVYLDAPMWWYEANPAERCLDYVGRPMKQSFASEKWRQDIREAFQALIDHIEASPWKDCVIGYHIAFGGTEECVYQPIDPNGEVDYSPCCLHAYQNWLKSRYGSAAALRDAWKHTRFAHIRDFDDVAFPDPFERRCSLNGVIRDLDREAHVIDFYRFNSWLIADTILYFCQFVKEYTDCSRITGAFYGYIWMLANNAKGHNAIYDLLSSPYIDFLSNAGGGFTIGGPIESYRMHNKLWFAEGDIRTCLSTNLRKNLPHAVPPNNSNYDNPGWQPLKTMEESVARIRNGMAQVLTHHAGIWFFDMFGGWFRAPEMMREIASLGDLMREQTEGPFETDVAVIMDEEGLLMYSGIRSAEQVYLTDTQRTELNKMGTSFHTYLIDDLASPRFDPDAYKVYIFIGCVDPSARARAGIERLKSGNRTLIWTYFSDMRQTGITDFHVRYDRSDRPVQAETLLGHTVYPPTPVSCGRFTETEADMDRLYTLACLRDEGKTTSQPAVLLKQCDGYRSVMSLLPCIPGVFLKSLVLNSGGHIYSHANDVVCNGGCYTAYHALTAGEKRINFPTAPKRVTDVSTGEEYPHAMLFFDFRAEAGETKIFRVEN